MRDEGEESRPDKGEEGDAGDDADGEYPPLELLLFRGSSAFRDLVEILKRHC